MSKAFKCDRCGKCYDPTEFPEDFFLTIYQCFINKGKSYTGEGPIGSPYISELHDKDFCKDCSQVILNEINKQENKQDEKKSKTFDAIVNDVYTSFNDIFEDFISRTSRGVSAIREQFHGDRHGDSVEWKSESEKDVSN